MDLNQQLNWRYATKRMNGQAVAENSLNNILEAIRLAPTSLGLQAFDCFVISDKDLLTKIHAQSCAQPQVVEGSHLIVFAAWKSVTETQVDDYINNIASTRNMPVEALADFKKMIMGAIGQPAEQLFQWNARQTYIALGFGLVAAANEKVDATPMEGFNAAALDEILGLGAKNMTSVCLLALGHRDEATDYLVAAKKVRRDAAHFFTKL
jgi:nitroreductase/dihydropteridine reductase